MMESAAATRKQQRRLIARFCQNVSRCGEIYDHDDGYNVDTIPALPLSVICKHNYLS